MDSLLPPPPPYLPPDDQALKSFKPLHAKIEILLLITFFIILAIMIFGWLKSSYFGKSIFKTISTKLLFPGLALLLVYVPGSMDQKKYTNDLFALWMAFLVYLAAVAKNYSCYSLADNEGRRKSLLPDYIIPWGAIALALYQNLAVPQILIPVAIIFWMVFCILRERRDALNYATSSSLGFVKSTKLIYDFMKLQQKKDEDVEDGYLRSSYLVGVKEAQSLLEEFDVHKYETSKDVATPYQGLLDENNLWSKVVTLDKIEKNRERLDKMSSPGENLNDTCLSFALFWLLLATVAAGYDVDTNISKNISNEIIQINADDEEQVKRTFNVIQTELQFLFDYLYTNNYAIYVKGLKHKLVNFLIVFPFLWLTLPLLVEYRPQDYSSVYVSIGSHIVDVGITRFVILAVFIIELIHIGFALTSNWAKITYVCWYLQKEHLWDKTRGKCIAKVIKHARRISFTSPTKSVAQYSIVDSYDKIPYLMWFKCWIGGFIDVPRVGQQGSNQTPWLPSLDKAFIKYIKHKQSTAPIISNGTTSLILTNQQKLIDTYVHKQRSHSHVILVWHMATHFCHNAFIEEHKDLKDENLDVSTTLSNYCAYFVAFFPKIIPHNEYITQCAFDETIQDLFKQRKPIEGTFDSKEGETELSDLGKLSTLQLARHLAREVMGTENPWELLADFWKEMLLFLALSNDFDAFEAHAEFLCSRGELLTYLWALLNHAGCSRDPNVKPIIKA